jgi:hypothetical protein
MKHMHLSLLCLLGFAICTSSCAKRRDRSEVSASKTTLSEPSDVVGEDVMLALAMAKNLHHKAQVMVAEGDVAGGIVQVRKILSLQFPAQAVEAEDVRIDARALLGKLLARTGQEQEAMTVVTEGLAAVTRKTFFVANLYTVKGELLQQQAEKLEATAPSEKAKITELRRQAIAAFDESIGINDGLQRQLQANP